MDTVPSATGLIYSQSYIIYNFKPHIFHLRLVSIHSFSELMQMIDSFKSTSLINPWKIEQRFHAFWWLKCRKNTLEMFFFGNNAFPFYLKTTKQNRINNSKLLKRLNWRFWLVFPAFKSHFINIFLRDKFKNNITINFFQKNF